MEYLIDTHAHLMDPAFADDYDDFLARTLTLRAVVNIGCNFDDAEKAVALAEREPKVFAAVALHPEDARQYDDARWARLVELAHHDRVIAIGETGLDYHWDTATPEEQKILLARHIDLAKELDKPLIIHDREAHRDCFDALWAGGAEAVGGVFHAYSGSVEMMHEAVAHNFYIGLGGVVTFKNAKTAKAVACEVPLDRLLIETDCPYMTPVPFRGKRNEPIYTQYVAEEIARLRGVSVDDIKRATFENACRLFKTNF
ncbi:MAG: TatD family hydrolase [Peptococcaceae bacterium]|nr:TatD family hydrolase [Peptococcaceae bacterium]